MWDRNAWGGRHGGMQGRGRRPGGGGRFFDHGALRFVVLSLLNEKARNGYELIKAIEEKSAGSYSPSPGVIYPTLNLLEEAGHVRPVEVDGKKAFEITDEGKASLEANHKIVETFEERMQGDAEGAQRMELRQALGRLTMAIRAKMAEGGLPEEQLQTLIAAIHAAADEVEKS
jgi:DNA-binding PadR family transcriptional regulator